MPDTRLKIFISSVQKELADERRAVADFIRNDPLLRLFFDVFLFEDLPASDRRAPAGSARGRLTQRPARMPAWMTSPRTRSSGSSAWRAGNDNTRSAKTLRSLTSWLI
jgi:hypothetical protein